MAVASSQPEAIQSQIKIAISSRIDDFRDQSKSLTFQNVRRLLEKDLGLEPLTLDLDFHRSFIKEFLAKCLNGTGDDSNVSMTSKPTKAEQLKKEVKKPKDSPDLGLVSEHKASESGSNKNEPEEILEVSVGELKKAIRKIVPYVEANLRTITVADLLRLLEKDMKLDEHDLDRFKKRITDQLKIYLQRKSMSECSQSTASSNSSSKQMSDSPKHDNGVKDEEDMEISEEKELSGRKNDPKKNHENSAIVYKRKRPDNETNALSEKRIRAAEKVVDNGFDAEETRMVSEGDQILSSSAMKAALFELTNAKELAEEAKRQAEKAKEEAEMAKEEVKRVTEVAEKSITSLKSKYETSVRKKNKELTTAKELAEEAQRQAKQAKEEAVSAKEEAASAKEEAKKSITAFKTKTENMERHIADLERHLDEARLLASQAIDDFKASKTCEELLGNLVGPYMEGAFHNFRMQAIADFPQLENRFKQYKLDFDMLIQSCETDDE